MSNSNGTLTPILVAQQALSILTDSFPFINAFTQDFSNEPVLFNQTVYSRIPTVQGVQDYDTTNGYVASNGTLTDVPVSINKHRHTSIAFNDQELASTQLNLVEQYASALVSAIGNDIASGVFALVTTGNYSTAVAITSGSLATRNNSIVQAKKSLDINKVPQNDRFFISNPTIESELLQDESIVKLTWGANGVSESSPNFDIHGFKFGAYTSLPSTSNLQAVGMQKQSIVIAGRAPEIPQNVPLYGTIENVTDPRTGLTVQVRMFYDFKLGKLQVTYSWMYGVAVGSANSLVRVTRVP